MFFMERLWLFFMVNLVSRMFAWRSLLNSEAPSFSQQNE